jgi:hypothetical protein
MVEELASLARQRRVTLLFGAAEAHCNNAVALKEFLAGKSPPRAERRKTKTSRPPRAARR